MYLYNCKTFVPKLNFNNANFDLMKLELSKIDWLFNVTF